MDKIILTPEQEAEAQRIEDNLRAAATVEIRRMAGLSASKENRHRMDDPAYISRGWQIGSGRVEAACKTVVGQRLKESGMRWREHGTTALSQLRALYKSEPKLWKNDWNKTLCS